MDSLLATDKPGSEELFIGHVLVNGRQIPEEQIYAEMQYHPAATPREAVYSAARSLVLGELLRERASDCGLCDGDTEINSDAFDRAVDRLLDKEVPAPEATREQCYEFFLENQKKFTSEPLAEVRHILLGVKPDEAEAFEEQKQVAETLLAEIKAAPDPLQHFAKLARQHSDCSSRDTDGSLGQVSRGDTVAPFEEVVFSGGTGLVEKPVQTKYGWHLIYVEQLELGRPLEFSFVEEKIGDYLQEMQQRKMINGYLKDLVSTADIRGIDMLGAEHGRD